MEASRGVRPRQKECTCAVDTWATVARGRGATGEATLHGGRESAWTALQLTALHHHLLASKLTLSNTQLISSMPRHPGYDVTEQPERQHAHFRPPHRCTESGNNYGLACCKAACEGVNARNDRFVSAVEPLAEPSMDSIAHHTRQLLLVATQLAQMGSDSVSATYNSSSSDHRALITLTSEERNTGLAEWTREVERLQAELAFSASTSSTAVNDAERSAPLLPLQADVAAEHSQESSARWLAELVAADPDSEAVDAQRYQAYAHLTGLALALSRWWQWMEVGGPRLGPPLSLSLPPLARAGYLRYATVVGREADRCESEQQLSKWQTLEERHSVVRLTHNPHLLNEFRQHQVCTTTDL